MSKHTPDDLMNLLRYVDVNGLTDSEADAIAGVDIDKDDQLEVLMRNWLVPRSPNLATAILLRCFSFWVKPTVGARKISLASSLGSGFHLGSLSLTQSGSFAR